MDEDKKLRLREIFIKEKLFLKKLYLGNPLSNRTALSFATILQLNVLIRILYHIVRGNIPMKKCHFETLIKSKKRRVLHDRLTNFKKLIEVSIFHLRDHFLSRFENLFIVLFIFLNVS